MFFDVPLGSHTWRFEDHLCLLLDLSSTASMDIFRNSPFEFLGCESKLSGGVLSESRDSGSAKKRVERRGICSVREQLWFKCCHAEEEFMPT